VDHFTLREEVTVPMPRSLQHDDSRPAFARAAAAHRKSDDAGPDNDALKPCPCAPGVPSMSLRGKSFFEKKKSKIDGGTPGRRVRR